MAIYEVIGMLQKENWRLQNLWVLLLCLFISLVVTGVFYHSVKQHSDEQIRHISSYYAERTGSFINGVFHKTDILTAVVKLNNGYMDEKSLITWHHSSIPATAVSGLLCICLKA
jgi:hypothetical protein